MSNAGVARTISPFCWQDPPPKVHSHECTKYLAGCQVQDMIGVPATHEQVVVVVDVEEFEVVVEVVDDHHSPVRTEIVRAIHPCAQHICAHGRDHVHSTEEPCCCCHARQCKR